MKILFTGASSFTGYWFVKKLSEAGHEITAIFTVELEKYSSVRFERVSQILEYCIPVWNCKFGDEKFLNLISLKKFDILCHHGAYVKDYKSIEFDIVEAIKQNTNNIKSVLQKLTDNGCRAVILTGTVFEPGEGCGTLPLNAFSPYGLSKSFTHQLFKYFTELFNIKYGKFVIPNPFGPFEDSRFTTYLVKNWLKNDVPVVLTPKYIRDNIHVTLLAETYLYFVVKVFNSTDSFLSINPSGYIETQGDFANRFANEIGSRLKITTPLEFAEQNDFIEPPIRVNYTPAFLLVSDWNEKQAWDDLAEYYERYRYEN